MQNFEYKRATHFFFGQGMSKNTAQILQESGYTKVLLVYGQSSNQKNGLLQMLDALLKKQHLEVIKLGGIKGRPSNELIYAAIDLGRQHQVDVILAVGGGSVIDTAKVIGLGIPYHGDFLDFFTQKTQPTKAIPTVVVLTALAGGVESAATLVIDAQNTDKCTQLSFNSHFNLPTIAILDPDLTYTLSPLQIACCVVQMFTYIIEFYITNTKAVELTDRLCEALLCAIVDSANKIIEDAQDYEARANLMWAGSLVHNDVCGVDRQQDLTAQTLSYPLCAMYSCTQGEALSVVLPAWLEYVQRHDLTRFAQLSCRVFNCQMDITDLEYTSSEGVNKIREFLAHLGLPLNFEQLGAKADDIPRLLNMLNIDEGQHTIGSFVPLHRRDVEQILRACVQCPNHR